jgi:hypothetical protein
VTPDFTPDNIAPTELPSCDRLVERNGRALDAKVGFELGWDIAAYGLRPPVLPNDALLAGYEESSSRRTSRLLTHDRFVRKWLQLRVSAWLRHRVVDEGVTPEYLRKIDAPTCPVTVATLTHGTGDTSDWSVDRINNEGAYAPGNLAVMSSKANQAKGRKSFAQVLALAAGADEAEGLTNIQWARMAAVMVVPCHLAQGQMPLIPYPLRPLPQVPLAFDQSLQWVLVNQCYGGGKTIIGKLKDACRAGRQKEFHQLVQKVRRKSEKLGQGWTDVWLNEALWLSFEKFIRTMDEGEFQRFSNLLSPAKAPDGSELIEAWQLDCRGYMPGYTPPDDATVAQGVELGVEEAADDDVSRALEAMAELPDVEFETAD